MTKKEVKKEELKTKSKKETQSPKNQKNSKPNKSTQNPKNQNPQSQNQNPEIENLKQTAKKTIEKTKEVFEDVKDETKTYTKEEKEAGKALSVVCYIIPPIPYFLEENNKFVKFHAKQGMNLLLITVLYWLLITFIKSLIKIKVACETLGLLTYQQYCEITPTWVEKPLNTLSLIFIIYALIGITYALQGKAKELPLINKIKIFKWRRLKKWTKI